MINIHEHDDFIQDNEECKLGGGGGEDLENLKNNSKILKF